MAGPCLDFGFQYALIRNNWSKKLGRILGLAWLKFDVASLKTERERKIEKRELRRAISTLQIKDYPNQR